MIHLGDITKINGADAPVVDVIIGGSPCQDLSMAGKRAGLAGERSGLYMEQLRVIKEMRHKDELGGRTGQFVRPRYMLWENVPGAFSCNHGADFSAVLTEAVRVIEPEAPDVPVPEKGWPTAGVLLGDEWSIAWRVLDAQYWGVPQRRRRIALVCDFGGQSAPEILFVSNSVSGHPEESRAEGKGAAGSSERSIAETNGCLTPWDCQSKRVFSYDGPIASLYAGEKSGEQNQSVLVPQSAGFNYLQGAESSIAYAVERAATLRANQRGEAVLQPLCFEPRSQDGVPRIHGDTSPTLNTAQGGQRQPCVLATGFDCYRQKATGNVAKTLSSAATDSGHIPCVFGQRMTVRRLTPLECERLQGYPDGWTDIGEWVDSKGKKHRAADSPRYKALGNSIALPPWRWVLKRLCSQYERTATMASLFDGIGGFPLIWEGINGKGSCLWASEIEEFPMAVTKIRFGDE